MPTIIIECDPGDVFHVSVTVETHDFLDGDDGDKEPIPEEEHVPIVRAIGGKK